MSLFGGDSSRSRSPSQTSDFSITPIKSPTPDNLVQERHSGPTVSQHAEQQFAADTISAEDSPAEDENGTIRDIDFDAGRQRFQGSDSAWRHHTDNERMLASSLDQLRANDLSIHLYNAHSWKARLRSNETHEFIGTLKRKNRWIAGDEHGTRPWYPEYAWTHWPLEPEKVPRKGEDFGVLYDPQVGIGLAATERMLPSGEDLQEDIYALMMQRAAEQWRARPPESAFSLRPSRGRSISRPRQRRSKSVGFEAEITSAKRSAGPQTSQSADEGLNTESDLPQIRPAPILSADEDQLRLILQPSVNHLMSRIDNLLMSLHHNRAGQSAVTHDSDAEESRASSLSRSRSRSRPRDGWKKNALDSETDHAAPRNSAHSASRSRSRKRSKTAHSSPLPEERHRSESVSSVSSSVSGSDYGPSHRNPRDWSEVLGLAAMTGWNDAALKRTLERCSKLFGEDMMLYNLDEQSSLSNGFSSHVKGRKETSAAMTTGMSDDQPFTLPKVLSGYSCPYTDCAHHTQLYPFSQGFRFREHLRRKHKLESTEIRDLEAALHISGVKVPSTKNNPRGWIPPEHLVCPHQGCKRSTAPFPESRRLVDHLMRAHKYDPRKESPPPSLRRRPARATDVDAVAEGIASASVSEVETDDDMVGGVHNDGFLQPIGAHVGKRGRGKIKEVKIKREESTVATK